MPRSAMDNSAKKNPIYDGIKFGIGLAVVLAIFLIIILVIGVHKAPIFSYIMIPNLENYMTYIEYKNLMDLTAKGYVLSADKITGTLISYYNYILAFSTICISGIIATVYFSSREKFRDELKGFIKQDIKDKLTEYTQQTEFQKKLETIVDDYYSDTGEGDLSAQFSDYKGLTTEQIKDLRIEIDALKSKLKDN